MTSKQFELRDETRIGAISLAFGRMFHPSKTALKATPVVVDGQRYGSTTEAAHSTGIPEKSVREGCNGKKTHYKRGGKLVAFEARWVTRGT